MQYFLVVAFVWTRFSIGFKLKSQTNLLLHQNIQFFQYVKMLIFLDYGLKVGFCEGACKVSDKGLRSWDHLAGMVQVPFARDGDKTV